MADTFDVVVAGGGLVGGTLALALAGAGLVVALVEAQPPAGRAAADRDPRASSVAYSAWRMWRSLGLEPALLPHARPVRRIAVEQGGAGGAAERPARAGVLAFDAADLSAEARASGEPLGWMVENARVHAALADALAAVGATVLAPARVAGREVRGPLAHLLLEDGRALAAPLVVAADGRGSRLRAAAGIGVTTAGYGQTGVTAPLDLERDPGDVARQVFAPGGPLALLPLTGNRASLVWSAPDDPARALLDMPAELFEAQVARRFGEAVGLVRLAGARRGFPLGLQLAERMTAARLALAGDAAHAVHPVAGQGLNLGLKDAAALAEVVVDARALGEDWGSAAVLERYARWRRFDRDALALGVDGLARLFSARGGAARTLAAAALGAAGATPFARRLFAREAGAATGDPPRLLRGEPLALQSASAARTASSARASAAGA